MKKLVFTPVNMNVLIPSALISAVLTTIASTSVAFPSSPLITAVEFKVLATVAKAHAAAPTAAASANAPSMTQFDKMEKYREIQRLLQIEEKRDLALKMARDLLPQVSKDEEMSKELETMISRFDEKGSKEDFDKAIKFLTGTKSEIYCRGVGLVEMTGKHNDGATSRLVLLRSNRKLKKDSYSHMLSGDWIIELSNTYRPAINSDVFVSAADTSYKVTETRQRPDKKWDKGVFIASWTDGKFSSSYSTNGDVSEPSPMFLATDFQLWGNADLAYLLTFKLGHEGHSHNHDRAAGKGVDLKSSRKVNEHFATYATTDSKGQTHNYKDCFRVDYKIELDKVEE